jgi:hypothetical protein
MPETFTPRKPRLNHVAMSVPAALLGPDGRRQLCDFYGEVFGWQELPTETIDHRRLVFGLYSIEQFVFLIADEEPMRCPRLDHFGMSVATEEELDSWLSKVRAYKERDDRVDLIEREVTDHGMLAITSFYVRYLLPMMIEVQWWRFAEPRAGS